MAGLEAALSRYARGNLGECQRLLDNLALQLEPDPSKEALLGQLQALIAQAQGDEKESRVFFNRARLSWKNAHSMGPELRLLEQNRLETVAQAMRAGHLLDPFEAPLPSQLGGDISPGRALPKVPENTETEPIAIPATAPSHRLVWLLALILLALGLTAWKLASQSGPPGSTPTPHARIVKSPPGRTRH